MKSERSKYKVTNIKLEDLVRILVPGEPLTVKLATKLPDILQNERKIHFYVDRGYFVESISNEEGEYNSKEYMDYCCKINKASNTFEVWQELYGITTRTWNKFSEMKTYSELNITSEETMNCLLTGEIEY